MLETFSSKLEKFTQKKDVLGLHIIFIFNVFKIVRKKLSLQKFSNTVSKILANTSITEPVLRSLVKIFTGGSNLFIGRLSIPLLIPKLATGMLKGVAENQIRQNLEFSFLIPYNYILVFKKSVRRLGSLFNILGTFLLFSI